MIAKRMPHHLAAEKGEKSEEEGREESNEADMELYRSHRRTQEDPSD
jgi:hypothetical protein